MLNFHKPSIADYGWIHDITYPANLPGVDMSFHNMYFWECYYGEVAQAAGFGCRKTAFRRIFIPRARAT